MGATQSVVAANKTTNGFYKITTCSREEALKDVDTCKRKVEDELHLKWKPSEKFLNRIDKLLKQIEDEKDKPQNEKTKLSVLDNLNSVASLALIRDHYDPTVRYSTPIENNDPVEKLEFKRKLYILDSQPEQLDKVFDNDPNNYSKNISIPMTYCPDIEPCSYFDTCECQAELENKASTDTKDVSTDNNDDSTKEYNFWDENKIFLMVGGGVVLLLIIILVVMAIRG